MLNSFKFLGCNVIIKVHYLFSHLTNFPENLGDSNAEQDKRFHQDIETMEERYQGRWNMHTMADYFWSLKSGYSKMQLRISWKKSSKVFIE